MMTFDTASYTPERAYAFSFYAYRDISEGRARK
jgi:hypothetical protein